MSGRAEEDLLEPGLLDHEVVDRARPRAPHQPASSPAYAKRMRAPSRSSSSARRERRRPPRPRRLRTRRARVAAARPAARRARADRDHAPAADHADALAQRLDLAQDVRREERGRARGAALAQELVERPPARSGRGPRSARRARAARARAAGPGRCRASGACRASTRAAAGRDRRVRARAARALVARPRCRPPLSAARWSSMSTAAHALVEARRARQVAEPRRSATPAPTGRVRARDTRPGVGAQQAERDADRRRLARAVRPEEAEHLARLDLQVDAVERDAARRSA